MAVCSDILNTAICEQTIKIPLFSFTMTNLQVGISSFISTAYPAVHVVVCMIHRKGQNWLSCTAHLTQ